MRLAYAGVWESCVPLALFVALAALNPTPLHAQQQGLQRPEASFGFWKDPAFRVKKLDPSSKVAEITRDLESADRAPLRKAAQELLDRPTTTALALVERGKLVFEGYAKGSGANDHFVGFSVSKSMTALAVGEALCAGKIRSLDDSASTYAPELAGTAQGESSVRHLLMMASGARAGSAETNGQPYVGATQSELRGTKSQLQNIREHGERATLLFSPVKPGARFAYSNLDVSALGAVLRGATGVSFNDWFQQSVVETAGLASNSYWHVDREDHAINYAFYSASLQDWVRLALRYRAILKGETGEECLRAFLQDGTKGRIATHVRTGFAGYGYLVWTDYQYGARSAFWMLGFAGQRIAVDLASDRMLVKFAWMHDDAEFAFFANWVRAD
jgi:CubicO group peptidase (beta-lactamase class C family)